MIRRGAALAATALLLSIVACLAPADAVADTSTARSAQPSRWTPNAVELQPTPSRSLSPTRGQPDQTVRTAAPARAMAPAASTAPAPPTATLTVTTVPAIAGVRLRFDDRTATTSATGTATFTARRNQDVHTLAVLDTQRITGDTRYIFSRWAGQRDFTQAFTPALNSVTTRTSNTVTAVFTVQRAINPSFVDQQGRQVDSTRISAVTARSSTGATVSLTPTATTWLDTSQVIYRSSVDLEVENISYAWQSVVVDGSNIIDAGRQSFTPARTATPTVQGKFHDLTVTAHDALFGFPAGTEVVLTSPDGSVRSAPMNESRTAVFEHLPRGTYQAVVRAGPAVVNTQHLRLSRDVTLEVPVISILDMAVLVLAVVAVSVGLLLIGRRSLRRTISVPRPALQEARAEST
jgi:hypothetical protein